MRSNGHHISSTPSLAAVNHSPYRSSEIICFFWPRLAQNVPVSFVTHPIPTDRHLVHPLIGRCPRELPWLDSSLMNSEKEAPGGVYGAQCDALWRRRQPWISADPPPTTLGFVVSPRGAHALGEQKSSGLCLSRPGVSGEAPLGLRPKPSTL
jgi:hypothetical protein